MKEEKVKSYKELLADQNWYFESHKEANEVAFRYAVVCPEFKFSVVKRGDKFFVGMKDPLSKESGYVNEPWVNLSNKDQVALIVDESFHRPQFIFIHSKGCGSSEKVKNLLVKGWDLTTISPWSFDILQYPQVSTSVLNTFGFEYAYPQVLLIVNGEIVNQSVGDSISVELIRSWVTP